MECLESLQLGDFVVKLNHRGVLDGMLEVRSVWLMIVLHYCYCKGFFTTLLITYGIPMP